MSLGDRTSTDWPPELDALEAAAEHHRLVFENDRVRVLETRIPPGETTGVHTHRWPAVYLIESWAAFVRRDADGRVMVDTRDVPGMQDPSGPIWSEPLPPHTLENVGDTPIVLTSIELKSDT